MIESMLFIELFFFLNYKYYLCDCVYGGHRALR